MIASFADWFSGLFAKSEEQTPKVDEPFQPQITESIKQDMGDLAELFTGNRHINPEVREALVNAASVLFKTIMKSKIENPSETDLESWKEIHQKCTGNEAEDLEIREVFSAIIPPATYKNYCEVAKQQISR